MKKFSKKYRFITVYLPVFIVSIFYSSNLKAQIDFGKANSLFPEQNQGTNFKLLDKNLISLRLNRYDNNTYGNFFQETDKGKPDKIELSTEALPPIKYAFGNLGYGQYGLWGALGFRWWYFGLSFGMSGFNKSLPAYRSDTMLQVGQIATTETYPKLVLHIEASFYYDVNPYLSLFASIGYFSENDSVLARPYDITDPYLYRYTENTFGGLCFGLGGHYFLESQMGIGLGYHTKNGFYVQLGYFWE